jgi:hypothetical protein
MRVVLVLHCTATAFGRAGETGRHLDDASVEAQVLQEPTALIGSGPDPETTPWQPRSVALTRSGNLLVADRDMSVRVR